jgi:hypothetical protein
MVVTKTVTYQTNKEWGEIWNDAVSTPIDPAAA